MSLKQEKTILQRLQWWWGTQIAGPIRIVWGSAIKKKLSANPDIISFKHNAEPMPAPTNDGITVILTAYKRAEFLEQQVKALRAQTIPPKEIWLWSNKSDEDLLDFSDLVDRVVSANGNYLFWGRFALANLARTGYVAFFDDDTLPQPKWFENCLNTINDGYDGILGGSGVILPESGGYSGNHKVGWNGKQLSKPAQVDLVGHAWFMRKEYVNYMWREEPFSWDNGEDMHLSYMALKHGGIKTWVPPHPQADMSLWSCRPDFGKSVGRIGVATHKSVDHKQTRSDIVNFHRENGWNIVETVAGYSIPVED